MSKYSFISSDSFAGFYRFVASGAISQGDTVALNGSGTVSIISTGNSNVDDYIGVASENISNGTLGVIRTYSGTATITTHLTIGEFYYVDSDGSLLTTDTGYSKIGKAVLSDLSDTKLLIHSNDSNGNTSFTDSSSSAHTVTGSNSVAHSTTEQTFGYSSIFFDGSDDYITLPSHADWTMSGEFTIESWIYRTGNESSMNPIITSDAYYTAGYNGNFQLLAQSSGYSKRLNLKIYDGQSSVVNLTGTTSLALNTWYHVAVTRDGSNTVRLFVNGDNEASITYTGTLNATTDGLRIGRSDYLYLYYMGYMDEVSVSKGVARWVSNFSVPGKPYGSKLLLTN